MFVDRSRVSCNLFFFSLFIYFPPLFFSPFQTFRLLLIYRPKEVSTCEDSRLIVKRIFPSGLNSNGKRRYIYHLVLKKFLIKVLKLILFPIRKEWTLKFKILFFLRWKRRKIAQNDKIAIQIIKDYVEAWEAVSKAVHQRLSPRTARRLCFNSRADPLRTFIPKRFRTMHTGCALSASRRIRRRSGTKRHVRRRNVALLVESSMMLIGGDASRAPGNIHEITGCRAALRFDARRSGNE